MFMLSIFVFFGVIGYGSALAANPDKIKVGGILLPLTGPFAAVAETQKEGALLAVDVVNKTGGLNMPWGKVKASVADDEAKQDVGVRRYRYMVDEGIKGLGG
jgi:branched-chain amino acid transport system substrate-binding protein